MGLGGENKYFIFREEDTSWGELSSGVFYMQIMQSFMHLVKRFGDSHVKPQEYFIYPWLIYLGGGGVSDGSKMPNFYFGKVFFQLACRIILGPPKHVLHLVWSSLHIYEAEGAEGEGHFWKNWPIIVIFLLLRDSRNMKYLQDWILLIYFTFRVHLYLHICIYGIIAAELQNVIFTRNQNLKPNFYPPNKST